MGGKANMSRWLTGLIVTTFSLELLFGADTGVGGMPTATIVDRSPAIRGSIATYDNAPRTREGRVDIDTLLAQLVDLRANTYHWLIWHAATDWEDLQRFLPLAHRKGILVWVCLVPPSESPPHTKSYSEPFRLDYERWAAEFATLGLKHPNLVAWSVDDFTHNLKVFTPERMRKIHAAAHAINPRLTFVPCSYFPSVKPAFALNYRGLIDGILFPYRHESAGANLKDASLVESEVTRLRQILGPELPIIVDVYASSHSSLGASTPEYVRQVMESAIRCADGVHIYCHQQTGGAGTKYEVIKQLFTRWADDPSLKKPRLTPLSGSTKPAGP